MSNIPSLKVLYDHRDALLLAEVAAWLHMLGKFHEDFLNGDHELDIKIPHDLTITHPLLDNLLRDPWITPILNSLGIPELQANSLSIFDLSKEHRNPKAPTGLQRLMQDAHGRGSGSEKGALERFFAGQTKNVFVSTAVGYEPDQQPIDLQKLERERKEFYQFLENRLKQLRETDGKVNWTTFRREFISQIEKSFHITVAETRRPVNDVTLFDQTFASVAVFKASLAQNLLLGWADPTQTEITKKYHWRILRVGLNGLKFWAQSTKLVDLLGRKECIKDALEAIQDFLEQDYPLGMEIYRDENGSLFIVPDIPDLLNISVDGMTLCTCLQEIAHNKTADEAEFILELSERTRTMFSSGQLLNKKLPPPSANSGKIDSIWQTLKKKTDICTVCGIRPQGYDGKGKPFNQKALQRNVCGICERRRADRSSDWVDKRQTTVWTNEIIDENGRLALIVGKFKLDNWLNGAALGTVMAFEPSARNLEDSKRNKKQYHFDYKQLLDEIRQSLQTPGQLSAQFSLLDNLLLSYQRIGYSFFDTYNFYVGNSDLDTGNREAHLFALALMRQQPSPARLRRIWETTRNFWQAICNEINMRNEKILLPVEKRLEIVPRNRTQLDLGKFHSYDLVVNNIRVSVVWDSTAQRFIVCDNLTYLAKPEQLGKPLQEYLQREKSFVLEESASRGAKNRVWGSITIENVSELQDNYLPFIPILAEPQIFMALIPADRALKVVNAIKSKYEREMGKVQNRLPLHLGVVFASRRTPLQAILEAGRAMLQRSVTSEQWTVTSNHTYGKSNAPALNNPAHSEKWQEVRLKNAAGREITLPVSIVMGDGKTEDVWYPYWRVKGKPTDRARWFTGPDGEHWVHVCDLRQGDEIAFTPSTFDFEFLDSASRRFEVYYDEKGRRPRRTRPLYLQDVERLEKLWEEHFSLLKRSQFSQMLQTIEAARERWNIPVGDEALQNEVFCQFVKDTLTNAKIPSLRAERSSPPLAPEIALPAAARNDIPTPLIEAATRGELADWAEIHLEILKEKMKGEQP